MAADNGNADLLFQATLVGLGHVACLVASLVSVSSPRKAIPR
jgi:hypothetical protein